MVRALKDAEVCTSITTSQLDLLLTKINLTAKASASAASTPSAGASSSNLLAGNHLHPSLLATSRVLKKTSSTVSMSAGSINGGGGGSSGPGNSSKGEQNSNSLAGASFSTFCALMNAIAGIVFSSG